MNVFARVAALSFSLAAFPYLVVCALYAWLRPTGSPVEKRSWLPTVSVLLPTYDEAAIVERKLEELLALDYPMERLEVVVIDASDDATPELVEAFFAGREAPELVLVEEEGRAGVASAVNRGVAAASGEVCLRTDCDSRLDPRALREAVGTLADPGVGAVTGRQVEVLGGSDAEASYRDLQAVLQAVETRIDSTLIAHGPCFAFERRLARPIASDSLADDTELAVGIRRGGARVVMDPAMTFTESGVSGFRTRRKRKDRRAMGLLGVLWRERNTLGRDGRYGRLVLPLNWWLLLVTPLALAVGTIAATASALVRAGPVGLAVPAGLVALFGLGSRDALGPFTPLYALADAQVSLVLAMSRLAVEEDDGTWEIDRASREAFE